MREESFKSTQTTHKESYMCGRVVVQQHRPREKIPKKRKTFHNYGCRSGQNHKSEKSFSIRMKTTEKSKAEKMMMKVASS